MPTITIYLTNDLYDKVRDAPSKTVRTALEYYFRNKDHEPAEASGPLRPAPPGNANPPAPPNIPSSA